MLTSSIGRHVFGLALALALTGASASTPVGVLSFSGVRDSSVPQVDYDNADIRFTQQSKVADTSAASSSITTGSARAQSLLGTNRVEAFNFALVDNEDLRRSSIGGPFAVGVSAWFDTFTINGGSGNATASISASVTGQFGTGLGAYGSYLLLKVSPDELAGLIDDPVAALFFDTAPVPLLALNQSVIDTTRFTEDGELLAPGSAFGGTLVGEVDFVYSEPFVLLSVLVASANDMGSLSAFNSAVFGISAPSTATLLTGSQFTYATAVPEPAAAPMIALGLALLWMARRRFAA